MLIPKTSEGSTTICVTFLNASLFNIALIINKITLIINKISKVNETG